MAQDTITLTLNTFIQKAFPDTSLDDGIPISITVDEAGEQLISVNGSPQFKHSDLISVLERTPIAVINDTRVSLKTMGQWKTIYFAVRIGDSGVEDLYSGAGRISEFLGGVLPYDRIYESVNRNSVCGFKIDIPEQHVDDAFMSMLPGMIKATSDLITDVVIGFKNKEAITCTRNSFGMPANSVEKMDELLMNWFFSK